MSALTKVLPSDWYNRGDITVHDFQGLPLLCLHNLLGGLERRIIARLGGDVEAWERDQDDIGQLDYESPLWSVHLNWLENWRILADHTCTREWREIQQLRDEGRVA